MTELETAKINLNNVIFDVDASYKCIHSKDFYLNTTMSCFEYMRILTKHVLADIMEQHNLTPLIINDHVLVEIKKGMYGLPQAGRLAQD